MNDLIDEVKIDGKHSYEDTILDVRSAKKLWGIAWLCWAESTWISFAGPGPQTSAAGCETRWTFASPEAATALGPVTASPIMSPWTISWPCWMKG